MDAPSQLFIDGSWRAGASTFPLLDKYTQAPVAEIAAAGAAEVRAAVDAAVAAQARMPNPYERSEILLRVRDIVRAEATRLRDIMVTEAGFPLADAAGEIDRALQTLAVSAEEAKRLVGEVVPFTGAPGGAGRMGFTLRVPIGVVAAITPFNSPVNTVCHKIAPSFAAGNSTILKPAAATPLASAFLVRAFERAGAPAGSINLLQGSGGTLGQLLLDDERIGFFAFTGSTTVGREIQARAGLRRTQMELGSIAATIVFDDADVDAAVPKAINSSFRKAGQVCTSIQLLLVQDGVYDRFRDAYLARARILEAGDPRDPKTQVGPMINPREAERVERWVAEAAAAGASILTGGTRDSAVMAPTVIEGATDDMRVMREEIFGPVVCLVRFRSDAEALQRVNATPYGLATGIFTRDIQRAFAAARTLRVGAVHVNETCSSRVDLMPYGGVKLSGFGQEGPRYAIREMMEERLLTFTLT